MLLALFRACKDNSKVPIYGAKPQSPKEKRKIMYKQIANTLLTLSMLALGQPSMAGDCESCQQNLSASPAGSSLSDEQKVIKFTDKRKSQLRALAQGICYTYMQGALGVAKKAKEAILRGMYDIDGKTNPSNAQILTFLNQNKHYMLCTGADGIEKNYMNLAFDRGMQSELFEDLFYDDLMLKETDGTIDVNAISYTGPNGSPETVLDYMGRYAESQKHNTTTFNEVNELKEIFIYEFNAKHYKNLSASEKKSFR